MEIVKYSRQPEVAELFKKVIEEDFSDFAEHHVQLIINDIPYYLNMDVRVAVEDGKVIGICVSERNTLEWLLIDKESRGIGVGSKLLKDFENGKVGLVELFAYKNNPYINFYTKHNYKSFKINSEAIKFFKDMDKGKY